MLPRAGIGVRQHGQKQLHDKWRWEMFRYENLDTSLLTVPLHAHHLPPPKYQIRAALFAIEFYTLSYIRDEGENRPLPPFLA